MINSIFNILAIMLIVIAYPLQASSLSIPNTFSAGSAAVAEEVNGNFDAVKTAVDDNDRRITTNATDISINSSSVSTNTTVIGTNASAISANAGVIAGNASDISTNYSDITNLTNNLSSLQSRVNDIDVTSTSHANQINNLEASIAQLSSSLSTISSVINMMGCSALTRYTTFDYTTNNGVHVIGSGELIFDTYWSRGSTTVIYTYNNLGDQVQNVETVAVAPLSSQLITDVTDASSYPTATYSQTVNEGQLAVMKNTFGNYAVLKVINVKDATRGDTIDELTFEYCILPYGQTKFSK